MFGWGELPQRLPRALDLYPAAAAHDTVHHGDLLQAFLAIEHDDRQPWIVRRMVSMVATMASELLQTYPTMDVPRHAVQSCIRSSVGRNTTNRPTWPA